MENSLTVDYTEKWCVELHIQNYYSTLIHHPANRQVETTNKTLIRTLKNKLNRKKGVWVEFVQEVLWSYDSYHNLFVYNTKVHMV
jgi:hypothetical protein